MWVRKRQGLDPDFMVHAQLAGPNRPESQALHELKTLHFGSSTYPAGTRRCEAVARRARVLPGEYAAKARQVDQKYCDVAPGDTGPVTRKLQSFDDVRGLVFGAWGETSPAVEQLLSVIVRNGANHLWRPLGCVDVSAACGLLAWTLRRRWALTALRENARLKLDRLALVGRGAEAAAQRRLQANTLYAARARAAAGRRWLWR